MAPGAQILQVEHRSGPAAIEFLLCLMVFTTCTVVKADIVSLSCKFNFLSTLENYEQKNLSYTFGKFCYSAIKQKV